MHIILLSSIFVLNLHAAKPVQPAAMKTESKTPGIMTFNEFVRYMLEAGGDRTLDAGRARFLEAPAGAPEKGGEFLPDEVTDNLNHASELILDPSADKPKPLYLVLFSAHKDLLKREKETYYFRFTPEGVLDKSFVGRSRLDESGKPVRGSVVVENKDINSIEIKERLKHELNFWLKGMYRKSPEEIASKNAGAAPVDEGKMQTMIEQAVRNATQKPTESASKPALSSDVDEPSYKSAANPNNFAIVVGVEKYVNDLPAAQFAERDAQAVREHLVALGYPLRNITLLTGPQATKTGLIKNLETWLPSRVKENSNVFFYFSGHGAPDPASGQAYLVPTDGDPEYLKDTAYPLKRLYEKLNGLKAKRVIVALDACFSGRGGRSVMARNTKPLITKIDAGSVGGNVIAFSASEGNQTSVTLEDEGHGLFTYYFLRGLNGDAKDKSGGVTVQSLYDYLLPNVQDMAKRQNRDQTPQLLPASLAEAGAVRLR